MTTDPLPGGTESRRRLLIRLGIAAIIVLLCGLPLPSTRAAIRRELRVVESGILALVAGLFEEIDKSIADKPLPGLAAPPNTHIIDTGLLDQTNRWLWHRTAEGSDVFPVALFRALKDPETGRPFIEVFDRFGFIGSPVDDSGLPTGFSRVAHPHHPFVLTGINCAACHSTQITHKGQVMHIDGAPSLVDVEAFFRGTMAALHYELHNPDQGELVAFVGRFAHYNAVEMGRMLKAGLVVPPDHPRLAREQRHQVALGYLREKLHALTAVVDSFDHQTQAGPGRADSFGIIRNMMMTKVITGSSGNFRPMTAPVSIPHLFGFGSFTNLHWDGNTTMGNDRNYAQAIALGADFDESSLSSSVRPYGVYGMETNAWNLRPPAWPESILGTLDQAKVARGKELFRSARCIDCHSGEGWHKLEVVGTDPNRLLNYNDPIEGENGATSSYATNLFTSALAIKEKAYAVNDVPRHICDAMDTWHENVPALWRETRELGYFTRPLRGVWATAPFLHNNSVPTLWDLLQPAARRPARFAVGHREFDPVRVGFIESPTKVIWELDTSISGNRNTGHEFGTNLSDEDKWALIEYLKTL